MTETGYVPKDYWLREGVTYQKQFRRTKEFELQEQILVDYLKGISPPFATVLELGCGFGRVTKLLLSNFDVREYVAADLSPDQVENAKAYLGDMAGRVKFFVSDIQGFQNDKKYDLVIVSEVLMHVLPSDVEQVIRKLADMSARHVVNIDWYEDVPRKGAPHNFIHQYEAIYCTIPSVVTVNRIPVRKGGLFKLDVRQSIFHATVEQR